MRIVLQLLTLELAACSLVVANDSLETRAHQVLRKYCIACHGDEFKYPGLDLRHRESLIRPADENEEAFLVPGNPSESRIWERADTDGGMPPEDQPQPSDDERNILRKWIAAGAEFPKSARQARAFVAEFTVLDQIAADIQRLHERDRPYVRYFSLAHLWNNANVSDEQLRFVRAGVSKLINSLSSQPRIVAPKMIDSSGLVLRIDLRDYGWKNSRQWLTLLKSYPWGLTVPRSYRQTITESTRCDLPYIRADWFVHAAARPNLYHELVTFPDYVGIPRTSAALEKLLSVSLYDNIQRNRVWRAGFSGKKSGVSDHNRIVERHDARYGYYWPSYDSGGDSGRQNFARFPLGPVFAGRENLAAFEHDGGEFIFSLPNGLQGYMLATADGNRIDIGPRNIVRDPNQFSGSYDIVNGISCIGCHKHGMIPATDTIRVQWENRNTAIAERVMAIYAPKKEFDDLLAADRRKFLSSLDLACGQFLRTGLADKTDIRKYPEPITSAARLYQRDLYLADIARELGLPQQREVAEKYGIRITQEELAIFIKASETLRRLEMLPLTVGEPITRKQWERSFPATARELGTGSYLMVR